MTHTPGPYHIEDASENLTYPIYKIVKTSDGLRSVIATCADMALCEEHGGTVANNARLIAAAPDLLEELKELVNELEICREWGSLTNDHFVLNEPLTAAKKAIAKAEGKETV